MLKTAFLVVILFTVVGVAFWFLMTSKTPLIISDQKQIASPSATPNDFDKKLNSLENKVNSLENSNSVLQNKITELEGSKSKTPPAPTKTPVLIPINPGGNINTTDWSNLNSGSITINPEQYPGFKEAYLIINLSVYVGQGKAFARLVNEANGLAILDSEVSTDTYSPVRLMSKAFKLPQGSNKYTIQLKTLVEGYPAQAADSFLQITY